MIIVSLTQHKSMHQQLTPDVENVKTIKKKRETYVFGRM